MSCESCGFVLDDAARFCSACGASVRRSETAGDPLRDELQLALPPNLQIVRPLGRGGMGAVYLARDEFLDREVAIKTLPAQFGDDPSLRDRFRREARIAAKLHHPNIVPLHTFGEGTRLLYYVMGFVQGETLAQRLHREGAMDPEESRRILAEIAEALRHAHAQAVIHRDLKPENILLDDTTGTAVLADFGIARLSGSGGLTRVGAVLGTPHYMAPEQASGDAVDSRTDLYSLGVVGYRMLTGRLPVTGETLGELLAQHAARKPEPVSRINPAVPQDLADIVMRCLEKNPEARWQSAGDLREALTFDGSPALNAAPEMQTMGVYLALFSAIALLLTPYELFFWKSVEPGWRIMIELLQLLPAFHLLIVSARVYDARKKMQTPWPSIWRSLFHPPRWYWGWTPLRWRPAGDLWDSLPRTVRFHRHLFTAAMMSCVVFVTLLPLFFLADVPRPTALLVAAAFSAIMVTSLCAAFVAEISLKRLGLDDEERSACLFRATFLLGASRTSKIAKALRSTGSHRIDASEAPTVKSDAATNEATTPK
ncbi:MAG: eukaryotic-like serine/threonine-protein kinase [Thermoanaerobaculia bacterium]|jgi:predicted Ser/Thr protein kinase|nr:eukaryotic-like serine/threonine-protein kinase [Thermoanaerobaculia bacterium]